jgi:hypothetical protein
VQAAHEPSFWQIGLLAICVSQIVPAPALQDPH